MSAPKRAQRVRWGLVQSWDPRAHVRGTKQPKKMLFGCLSSSPASPGAVCEAPKGDLGQAGGTPKARLEERSQRGASCRASMGEGAPWGRCVPKPCSSCGCSPSWWARRERDLRGLGAGQTLEGSHLPQFRGLESTWSSSGHPCICSPTPDPLRAAPLPCYGPPHALLWGQVPSPCPPSPIGVPILPAPASAGWGIRANPGAGSSEPLSSPLCSRSAALQSVCKAVQSVYAAGPGPGD